MQKLLWKLPSLLVIFIAMCAIVGWMAKIQPIIQIYPTFVPTMFNSAICLLIAGIALCIGNHSTWTQRIQLILSCSLAFIASLILIQDIFQFDFGIDRIHIARMAPNETINYILIGSIFILWPFSQKKFVAIIIESSIFTVFLISALGLIGYLFNVEFLYGWFQHARMSLLVTIGFILLSFGFWHEWRLNPFSSSWYQGREDKKIILISSEILLLIALIAGLTSLITVTKQESDTVGKTFQHLLSEKTSQFVNEINQVYSGLNGIRENEIFQRAFIKPIDKKNIANLQPLMQLFLSEGFSAVSIYDKNGELISTKGNFIQNPRIWVKLKYNFQSVLLWKNGWYLRVTSPINSQNKDEGFMRTEWPLANLERILVTNPSILQSAEYVICAPLNKELAACFPSRLDQQVRIIPFNNPRYFPVKNVFEGQSGVAKTIDSRNHRVLSAYEPIGRLGLGMFLKIDQNEIYSPIIEKLHFIIPIIFLAIFAGIMLLRLAVMPLVRKVIDTDRKLLSINERLTESEERYALAVSGSQVGLWDWDIGTGQIFYSPLLKKMLGFDDAELANTIEAFMERLHPDDQLKAAEAMKEHIKNDVPYNMEYRLRAKDDEYYWFQVVGKASRDQNGRAVRMAGSVMDITERKKSQRRLATQYIITQLLSEATNLEEIAPKILRAICEGMDWDYGGIWIADYQANLLRCEGMWHRPTLTIQPFEDYSRELKFGPGVGLLGQVWSSAKPKSIEDVANDPKFLRAEQAKIAGLSFALGFPILLGYKVLGVIEFFTQEKQVSDDQIFKMMETIGPQIGQFIQRKTVENELRESEAHKSAILESASDSIITIDDQRQIVSCNVQTEKMFGYTAAELQHKMIDDLVPELGVKIAKMEGKIPAEFLAKRNDGTNFPAELTISEMLVGSEHRYVSIVRDITERKKVDSLKQEFVAMVSHELRTPLTSIRGSLGLILGGAIGDFSEKAQKLLGIANNNCERLLLLINDILDIEKIEAGKMEYHLQSVDINKIVNEAIDANQMYAEKYSVKLVLTESIPETLVNVDSDRLIQVLTNLISNAAKFSPAGEEVKINIQLKDDNVRVSIADKGSGIPEDFKPRIFQKFSQADSSTTRNKGGTGLGLSISKTIIEKFGGILNYESEVNKGATFYFDLPKAGASKITVNKPEDKKKEPDFEAKLLICEDDPDQADYLRVLLESAGYYVNVSYNVTQAKDFLEKNKYDALLLDLILPDQDGIAFIRELRNAKATHDLAIIVTSVICEEGREQLRGDGVSVVDWLDKPIDFVKLISAIKVIKKRHAMEKPRILHVEDDYELQKIVAELLRGDAVVTGVDSVQSARNEILMEEFDLVILDLMLPDGNGAELLPLLTEKHLPVIVLSSMELDQAHAKYVSQILSKSEISNQALLERIQIQLNKTVRNRESLCKDNL